MTIELKFSMLSTLYSQLHAKWDTRNVLLKYRSNTDDINKQITVIEDKIKELLRIY